MNTKNTLSISEARKRLFEMAKKVQIPSTHYILTDKGRPKVALMSAEEFESWQETLEVLGDLPDLEKDIEKAEKEYKKGTTSTLEDILSKEGYFLAEKSQK